MTLGTVSVRGRPTSAAALLVALMMLLGAACSSSDTSGASSASKSPDTDSDATSATTAPTHASGPSPGCDHTPVTPAGTTDEKLTSGGEERQYQLIVPKSYDGKTPLPVVFGLHSLTVDYHIVPPMAGFGDMAKNHDFIGVSPSGLLGPSGKPYWNAAPVKDNYDLTFITELLDHLEQTMCVDTARVFSVGMSNGAQMSSLLACRMGDRVTAIAPIAGVEYNDPCDGPPVPVIAFHGAADPIVPYAGGGLNSVTIADQNYYKGEVPPGTATPTGVDESMRRWAAHNGCAPDPVEERISPEVRKRTWQDCRAQTELYIVDNGGHAWPGKPQPAFENMFGHGTSDIDATNLIFQFFFDNKG